MSDERENQVFQPEEKPAPAMESWSYPMPEAEPKKPEQRRSGTGLVVGLVAGVLGVLLITVCVLFAGYVLKNRLGTQNTNSIPQNTLPSASLPAGATPNMGFSSSPMGSDQNEDGSLTTKAIYKKVAPSVVGIAVYTRGIGVQLAGQGSGIILSEDGYVVTNYHVVAAKDDSTPVAKIEVILSDGTTYPAQKIGHDAKTDLAVLKIPAKGLPAAEFGDSDQLSVGDRVIVIGNPSGIAYAGSLTQGVVSALNRKVYMSELATQMEYIQTDAAINPGNSGGAFVNEYGQVVGISSAKLIQTGYEGMGFAIPINNARTIINALLADGYVKGRPKIGISYTAISQTLADLNGIPRGLRVVDIAEDSDALQKGLKKGDIITKMDGMEVYDTETVSAALEGRKPGETMVLTVYRINNLGKAVTIEIPVVLAEQTE